MRKLVLLPVLTMLGLVLSANLRSDSADANLRQMRTSVEVTSHPDDSIGSILLSQFRELNSNGAKYYGSFLSKTAPTSRHVHDTYIVTQSRSNTDCTGEVTAESGARSGSCHSRNAGGSYYIACDEADGVVAQFTHSFPTPDCTGTEVHVTKDMELNSCRFVPQFVPYYGFAMQSTHCSRSPAPHNSVKPGVMFTYHSDAQCRDSDVQYYSSLPFNTCKMYTLGGDQAGVLDSTSSFGYVMYTGCTADGQVNMRFFSDAQCTQVTHAATMELSPDPLYNACHFDPSIGAGGMWGTARCQA